MTPVLLAVAVLFGWPFAAVAIAVAHRVLLGALSHALRRRAPGRPRPRPPTHLMILRPDGRVEFRRPRGPLVAHGEIGSFR